MINEFFVDEEFVKKRIPPRKSKSRKGQNGTVCVVGGSRLFHGAPFLSARGALRAGVDLVYIATPKVIAQSVRALSPDFIVIPLPDEKLTSGNVNKLCSWLRDVNTIIIGPGLGAQKAENLEYAIKKLEEKTDSFVLDADCLRKEAIGVTSVPCIITPHAGEFERMFGIKLSENGEERIKEVFKVSKDIRETMLVKGFIDIIADKGKLAINNTHTPAMTVGGTGDVLAGICAGLLSKGLSPFDAACCAAYINGMSGIAAYNEKGLHITASDVADMIPYVMKKFDSIS